MDIELIVRTTAVLLAGAAISATLRRAAPSTRHLVWHVAVVAVLLAPFAPKVTVPGVPRLPAVSFERLPAVAAVNLSAVIPGEKPASADHPAADLSVGIVGMMGTVAVGSWFLFCWLLSDMAVWRGSRPAPESWNNDARVIAKRLGLAGPIAVRESFRDSSPHVAGFCRSVVIMPPAASSWSAEARQSALVHELTHLKRHDRRTQAVAQLACAVYWFNPLVWYAAGALARERERACDDEVLRFGAKPSAYATLLLDIAHTTRSAWTPATALSMARPSAIEGRLLAILADASRTPRRSTRWVAGFGVFSLASAILSAQGPMALATSDSQQHSRPAAEPRPLPIIKPQAVMSLDDQSAMPSVTRALIEALTDSDGQVREQAAMGLAITPGSEVIDPLLNALKDPDAQVREKAAIGLAFRGDPKIVEPLLTAIEDRDSQVREKAAIALGASGDPRAIDALTTALKDPDPQVREKAVSGLVLLGLRK